MSLAILLAGVAGAVNAAGFVALGTHTSHMTGQVATVGEAIATGQADVGASAAKLLGSFVLGAAAAAGLIEATRGQRRGRYAPALGLEAAILVAVAFGANHSSGMKQPLLLQGLCFAMGLQNALVTRISSAVVRTTHLTGVLTDLGIELIHLVTWIGAHVRQRGVAGLWHALTSIPRAPEFERAWLHLALVFSFLAGATVGPLLLLRSDVSALAIPSVVLIGLVLLDLRPRPASRSDVLTQRR